MLGPLGLFVVAAAQAGTVIYDDALASGWSNWSWGGSYDLASNDLVHGA